MSFDWKDFLKPSLLKVLGAIILSSHVLFLKSVKVQGFSPPIPYGFPYSYIAYCPQTSITAPPCTPMPEWAVLSIHIIFWYVVACASVLAYNRLVRK